MNKIFIALLLALLLSTAMPFKIRQTGDVETEGDLEGNADLADGVDADVDFEADVDADVDVEEPAEEVVEETEETAEEVVEETEETAEEVVEETEEIAEEVVEETEEEATEELEDPNCQLAVDAHSNAKDSHASATTSADEAQASADAATASAQAAQDAAEEDDEEQQAAAQEAQDAADSAAEAAQSAQDAADMAATHVSEAKNAIEVILAAIEDAQEAADNAAMAAQTAADHAAMAADHAAAAQAAVTAISQLQCDCSGGVTEEPQENPCGESDEIHTVWMDARAEAWANGQTGADVHQAVWDATLAAFEGSEEENWKQQLTCIGTLVGVSVGLSECDVIDATAALAADLEDVSEDEAWMWAEETMMTEVYPEWFTSYAEICGERPVTEEETGDNTSVEPCGETETAHKAWMDELAAARFDGASIEDTFQRSWDAAAKALDGENDKALVCIGVQLGYTTGLETCDIISKATTAGTEEGASEEDARNWADEALMKIYTWYTADQC